jgi:predicted hotdog family 3-hydroxylacyl-ACP dehydratase
MILIEEPFDGGDGWARASVQIAEDSMFYRPRLGVPAWVGIEYMAQTIALYDGINAAQHGSSIGIGLLLGTPRYNAETNYFPLGNNLQTTVNEIWRNNHMAVFDCKIKDQSGAEAASAELKVFKPENSIAFFKEVKR